MNDDFWAGVRLVVTGLADASQKASYSLGFGAGGFGSALLALKNLGVSGPELLLISMSAFFVAARVGKAVDDRFDRALPKANGDDNPKPQRRIEARNYRYFYRLDELQHYLSQIVREETIEERLRMSRKIEEESYMIIRDLAFGENRRNRLGDLLRYYLRRIVEEDSQNQRERIRDRFESELYKFIYFE